MEDKHAGEGRVNERVEESYKWRQLSCGSVIEPKSIICTFILCTSKQENMSNHDTYRYIEMRKMNFRVFLQGSLKFQKLSKNVDILTH